VKLKNDHNLMI